MEPPVPLRLRYIKEHPPPDYIYLVYKCDLCLYIHMYGMLSTEHDVWFLYDQMTDCLLNRVIAKYYGSGHGYAMLNDNVGQSDGPNGHRCGT